MDEVVVNDINKMPSKCQYCPYWEVCKFPWVCPDIEDKKPKRTEKRTETHACDLISRQTAIAALGERPMVWVGSDYELGARNQYDADVLALETVPSAQPETHEERAETHACDLIDRQAAIDALDVLCQEHRYRIPGKRETYSQYNEAWQDALDRAEGAIFNLPSAQPERKRGKWVYAEDEYGIDGYHCNQCGFFVPWDYAHKFINYIEDYHFCPNCGADMRGEQE